MQTALMAKKNYTKCLTSLQEIISDTPTVCKFILILQERTNKPSKLITDYFQAFLIYRFQMKISSVLSLYVAAVFLAHFVRSNLANVW